MHIYRLIEDSDCDAVEDPVDRDKLEDLFFKKGFAVHRCLSCGRLLIEWDEKEWFNGFSAGGEAGNSQSSGIFIPRGSGW